MSADLYFLLNPGLGIVKIGITCGVEERRRALEHACGVPLEVLRVVPAGEAFEQPLHFLFGATRLIGEWFAPTPELIALATGTASVEEYCAGHVAEVAAGKAAREAEIARRKAIRDDAARVERAATAALRAEEKRIKKEREAQLAAARKKREIAKQEADERARRQLDNDMARWRAHEFPLIGARLANEAAAEAEARRALVQRERNAAMIGLQSTDVTRNQPQPPRPESAATGVSQ